MGYRPSRRTTRVLLGSGVVLVLAATNAPAVYDFASERYHAYEIDQPEYKARHGQWKVVGVPEKFRINTIHAALLHTGKVLLIAGSGNNAKMFDTKTFRTVLWDPVKNTYENVPTPSDLFCAGHAQLPDGNLLVAGGTQRYETLKGDVQKAGGLMIVHNENPDKPKTLPAGTRFTGLENGKTFASQASLVVPRGKKTTDPKTGKTKVTAGSARVYVEALEEGEEHQTGTQDQYSVSGLQGNEHKNIYGIAQKLSFDKKDFQGIKDTYEFDPVAERYIKVDPMGEARWYPTLTTLEDGKVLSVSGLDEIGQVVPGKNEVYDPRTKKWRYLPKSRFFPTYPPDGRVMTFGSDSLFADEANSKLSTFEQRIELYTPPYLHQGGKRPDLRNPNGGRSSVALGKKASFHSNDPASIEKMRLLRPGAFTHVTNVEQRSLALDFKRTADGVEVTLPKNPALVPPGWYMVMAVDDRGVPSKAVWLHVPVHEDAPTRTATADVPAPAH